MRKLYTLILAVIAAVAASPAADATEVSVDVDNASRISLKINDQEVELKDGANSFTVNEYASFTFAPADGIIITKMKRNDYDVASYVLEPTPYYVYGESETFTVETGVLADLQTGSFSLTADNPSKIRAFFHGTYLDLDNLQAGENTVKFIPGVDTVLAISSNEYGHPLYSVTKNGEPVQPESESYGIFVEEGMNIDVKAEFPDIDVPVTFSFAGDGRDFITKVMVNENSESAYDATGEFDKEGFSVKCGDLITIYGNTADFKFNSLTINSTIESYFYQNKSFYVTGETSVEIDATKYSMLSATVKVDEPARMEVYKGYKYGGTLIDLKSGENAIEISSANPILTVTPTEGNYIASVIVDGVEMERDYSGYFTATVADGSNVVITSAEIVRDNVVMVYLDEVPENPYAMQLSNASRDQYTLQTGYTQVNFAVNEVPFYISIYDTPVRVVYLDNEEVAPAYEGGSYFSASPVSGSVLKLFTQEVPEFYNVSFSLGEGAADAFTAKHDVIVPFDPASGIKALTGTLVTLVPEENVEMKVVVDGEELAPAEGEYSFTVDSDKSVEVSLKGVGVEAFGSEAAESAVFDITGRVVLRKASAADVKALPAGIYIVNGKKIVK